MKCPISVYRCVSSGSRVRKTRRDFYRPCFSSLVKVWGDTLWRLLKLVSKTCNPGALTICQNASRIRICVYRTEKASNDGTGHPSRAGSIWAEAVFFFLAELTICICELADPAHQLGPGKKLIVSTSGHRPTGHQTKYMQATFKPLVGFWPSQSNFHTMKQKCSTHCVIRSHGKHIGQQSWKSWRKTTLCNKSQLELFNETK